MSLYYKKKYRILRVTSVNTRSREEKKKMLAGCYYNKAKTTN